LIYTNPIRGDFTLQTKCGTHSDEIPAIGGLLVWQDDKNWLCLEVGTRGKEEIIYRGFLDNQDMVFGRGRLSKESPIYLRMEKHGYHVMAFCSIDGENWLVVGNTLISSGEPIFPGIHAIGHINRLVYPGAYQQGTSITFHELALWSKG
jgi:hypothetical protein